MRVTHRKFVRARKRWNKYRRSVGKIVPQWVVELQDDPRGLIRWFGRK